MTPEPFEPELPGDEGGDTPRGAEDDGPDDVDPQGDHPGHADPDPEPDGS